LPTPWGRAGTVTRDDTPNGITMLFAALSILDGRAVGRSRRRHRHQALIRFLDAVEDQVAEGKAIHAVVDNDAAHKHPRVREWLTRHSRWTFHFAPNPASWQHAVEGFLVGLARRRYRRGVFRSVTDLRDALNLFVAETSGSAKPFAWIADRKRLPTDVGRGNQT
jgi:transposase